ncbi:hypothetical protein Anacy_1398 [Anabaena cylindrica PCC 7122]|uniref:Uncharacterized protein n=1 Tax=Anabaena cylindrica (strain ATCC 27899 / PCC 7122) TaxID=272123 RepID=K9ZDT8_ANACC|nr:hypothetical protein Anacy_1398 [Anabaena cylindrica PCC 7122]BAY06134.1 hypothetical protein NIES19_54170 [Anabaena cylindrica PCC 7122]
MKFDVAITISLISFLLLIGSNFIWLLKSYGNSERKRYAAEKDFEELRKNQEKIISNTSLLFRDIDHNHDLIFMILQEINYKVGGGKIEKNNNESH